MRKVIASLTASVIMAATAAGSLQGVAQANTARPGSADHAVTQVVAAGGGCGVCRPLM
jgi:hypothetical protein